MQDLSPVIGAFTEDKCDVFWDMIDSFGFSTRRDYYERCIERHGLKEIKILMAEQAGIGIGYALFNRQPKYALFKKLELPEVQDLNVHTRYRRLGVGQKLVEACEDCARKEGYNDIGIGVGLDQSFGAAQRLYIRLGYIPDGAGVSYDRKQVAAGEFRPIDDNLCLMMTKKLNESA
ncbi:MAG: GNAT family N-acetyltransferase [Alphaproteobacteria bacterium]